ncbi:MAG TPA: PAS domain S-box protein [Chthoniobacterales bacterium]|nr:PAS domain S-box protein [Chthoniobacterales bacterium]
MANPLRILILEDQPSDAELLLRELRRAGYEPQWKRVFAEKDFLEELEADYHIILSDYSMPQFDGIRALRLLNERGSQVPFILVSGTMGEETAVAAMKEGATDYLLKDRLARLGPAVGLALEQSRLRQERARAEEALRESEERFRQIAENIEEVFWITNPAKNQILYVSPGCELIWGRKCEDVYAAPESWLEAIHPEDRERIAQAASTKQVDGTYDEEYRIVRPDGSIRCIHDRAFPVRDGAGEIYRVVGVARDVTERRRSEEAIRASEHRFSLFMDNLPGFAWIKDADGRYVYANKTVRKMVMNGRDWFGKTAAQMWPAEFAASYEANDRQVLETKAPKEVVEPTLVGEEERTALNSKFPILNERGEVAFVCGIGIDITERLQAEERIREQADIINRAHDAIIMRDFETERITFWNAGAEDLYGWTADEAVGRLISQLVFADPMQVEPIKKSLLATGEFRGQIRQVTKNKHEVIVEGRSTLIRNAAGEPRSVLIINTDVTEHRKLETQLLRAQRLESIGTLASGVAHDLNNILAPILMGSAVLRRAEMEPDDEAILSTIETCAQRGADIVRQVLTFARGAEGDRLPLAAAPLIKDVAKIAEETFPKKISVRTRITEPLWTVIGDPTQLHQVLLNLSVNSRDAMPVGGTLTLLAENFPVDQHYASMTPGATPGPHVCFQVTDTGMGIPPQNLDKIFDPFFTTKELGHGTGLGLSSVLGIVKGHGGFMSVYSEVARGTTFKVFLPAKTGELDAPEHPDAEFPLAAGELILLVDDEKPILQIAQALLEGHGYQVLTAGDAAEALAIFATRRDEIKLVLTDLSMPVMDGVALIRTLRKIKPDVRLIASTGRGGQEQHSEELKELNVHACLTKPYNRTKLLKTLHEALHAQPDNS